VYEAKRSPIPKKIKKEKAGRKFKKPFFSSLSFSFFLFSFVLFSFIFFYGISAYRNPRYCIQKLFFHILVMFP